MIRRNHSIKTQFVTMREEEPVVVPRANGHPRTAKFLAMENEFQFAVFEACRNTIQVLGSVRAPVPNHDRSHSVLVFGNFALGIRIFHRLILAAAILKLPLRGFFSPLGC
jgi:hypothetical protein